MNVPVLKHPVQRVMCAVPGLPLEWSVGFCRTKVTCYAAGDEANYLIDKAEPESGRGEGAQAPALSA